MLTKKEKAEDIIRSYINGQYQQALDEVYEWNWLDFVDYLRESETATTEQKLNLLIMMIKLDKRGINRK